MSRVSLHKWFAARPVWLRCIGMSLAIGIGCGIAGDIAEAVLSYALGTSWPAWGGTACSIGGITLAVVLYTVWSFRGCFTPEPLPSPIGAVPGSRNDVAATRDPRAAA